MEVSVSIIVPIYNSEKYLEQCLNSVLRQTYTNYEVILIDDGSTDDSRRIYNRFIEFDNRFVSYYQKNQGVSAARNHGLDVAEGEIIIFLDSDDVLFPTFLEYIVHPFMDGKNLICFSAINFKKEIQSMDVTGIQVQEYTPEQLIENLLYHRKQLSITRAAYRREKYPKLRFKEELYICEDVIMLLEILISYTEFVPFIETNLYGYRIHKGSLTHYGNWRRKLTGLVAMDLIEDILIDGDIDMGNALINRRMNTMRLIYKTIPWKECEIRNLIWKNIKEYRRTVIIDRQAMYRERVTAVVSLCGQRMYRFFLFLLEIIK